MNINKHIYGVKKLCKVLGVPRSTYYAKLNYTASNREIENKKIKDEIIKITSVDYPSIGSIIISVNGFFSILRILKLVIHR